MKKTKFDLNKWMVRLSCLVLATTITVNGSSFALGAASIKTAQASGTTVLGNEKASIDASNASEGYVMVKYTGSTTGPIKLIIAKNGGTSYTYDLKGKSHEVFPFTEGNGTYKVTVFENVSGTKYVAAFGTAINVALKSETSPFLYPNQYVNFNASSSIVGLSDQVAGAVSDPLAKVQTIYNYTVNNLTYDYAKAKTVQSGYLPNIDSILSSKTGICFDYAAVMVAMLRSQGIPTKLIIGYAGTVYHAWISVYIKNVGWVDNIIYFDGTNWKIMDPTFASTSKPAGGQATYVPDEKTYSAKFAY